MLKRYSSDSSFIGENVGSKGYNDFSVTNDWTIFYQGHRTSGPWLKLEAKKTNALDFGAAKFVIITFIKMFRNVNVVYLQMDSTVVHSKDE